RASLPGRAGAVRCGVPGHGGLPGREHLHPAQGLQAAQVLHRAECPARGAGAGTQEYCGRLLRRNPAGLYTEAMHRVFQMDLYRLRLMAARAYVKALESSLAPVTSTLQEPLKMNAVISSGLFLWLL
ncbi:hypothetical protein G0U57_001565, partial [Chelydra serpentina]